MELLEKLAKIFDCEFISDLHYVDINNDHIRRIINIPDDIYTVGDFKTAFKYINGVERDFESIDDSKRELIKAMVNKKKSNY